MAKSGAKKRLEENRATLTRLSRALTWSCVAHVLVRVIARRRTMSAWRAVLAAVTALACRWSLVSLERYARPTYGENGELLDGGESLRGGLTEYYQDLIYVGSFALGTTTYSDRFWLVMLVVPGVLTWLIVTKLVIPYVYAPRTEEAGERKETKEEKRRRERSEKRAQRKFR